MYSGKIAVPPGGGGIRDEMKIYKNKPKLIFDCEKKRFCTSGREIEF
jgi:hypothetical protein